MNPREIAKGKQEKEEQLPVSIKEQRAASPLPLSGRMVAFPAQLRVKIVERDGKEFYELTGYATTFNQKYTMYDMFGEFTEEVDGAALDKSLAAEPDVAFLTNHRGVTMARTTNGTLQLEANKKGLNINALLNAGRADVQLLMSAIKDELVDEMSFAFMLNMGEWNEDYTEFRITEADINRGDVSAVNYGANPYTSIAARSYQFMHELEVMPASVQRAAYVRIEASLSGAKTAFEARKEAYTADKSEPADAEAELESKEEKQPAQPLSASVALYRNRLLLANED